MKLRVHLKLTALFLAITLLLQAVAQPLQQSSFGIFGTLPVQAADEQITQEPSEQTEIISQEEPEPVILAEVEEKRTADTKHFMLSDGSYYAVQYEEPVHYQDENGEWQQYDNSVVAENDELKNQKSDKDIRFSNKAKKNNMVKMTVDGYQISWGYVDVNGSKGEAIESTETLEGNDAYVTLQNITQQILYRDAFENVDLQYYIKPDGVKENIILKNAQAQTSYEIQYSIDKLIAYQADEKTIHLTDTEGNIIYILSAPFMTDAAGESSTAVTLTLVEQKNKKLTVVLEADEDWLQAEDRVYPVYLDPSTQSSQKRNANSGAFISSSNPSLQYGPGGNNYEGSLYVGRSNGYGKTRTLLKLDSFPALNKGDIIVEAYLSLLQRKDDADMQINAHRITKSWDESTVCWNSNITYDSTVLDYVTLVRDDDNYVLTFDITAVTKAWYNDTTDNNGIMLISATESEDRNMQMGFYSTSSLEVVDETRPLFTIIYRNNKGLESYWTYTQVNAGNAGVAYINDYTGNLVFIQDLVSTSSTVMPATLQLIYNGYLANQSETKTSPNPGKGFRLNIQQTLLPSSEKGLPEKSAELFPYVYTDGDGTDHYFYKKTENGTTTYMDEDGLGLKLTITSSSSAERYKITDDKNNVIAFYSTGRLNYIADNNGNKMTVKYASGDAANITGVTDGSGRLLSVVKNGTNMSYVADTSGRKTKFSFDSAGKLTGITNPGGNTIQYTYDSDGALSTVTDVDGYQLKFYYTSLASGKKVSRVEEYGTNGSLGQVITFDRTKYNTTVVRTTGVDGIYGNSDDIYTVYQFDNYGRTVAVESHTAAEEMGAASYSYTAGVPNDTASNIKQLNRVNKAYSLGSNTVNLVKNSSAEQTGNWTAAEWVHSCTFTSTQTTAQKYVGQKSLEINVTEHVEYGRARYYQDLDNTILKPGHTYTLSAYVKTNNVTNTSGTFGAYIVADIFHDDGTFTAFDSEYLYGTTDTAINNGWRRLSVTFTVPANTSKTRIDLAIRNCTGTVWFDAVQVEEAESPNAYNLVENSSFETYSSGMPTNWTGSSLTVNSSNDYITSATKHHGSYAFQMKGDASTNKYIYQRIPVSGTEDDIYILSGWAKANAVPDHGDDTRKLKISVEVKYSDGTSSWKTPVTFNYDITDWQFASTAFDLSDGTSATKTPTAIVIYPRYTNQLNKAYFDQIQLVKDTVQTYTYDKDGNMITVVQNAEQKSSMEYTNTDLTKSIDAKGYAYTYEYKNHNMTKATSQNGVVTEYTYDGKGQATEVKVHDSDSSAILKSEATYTNGYLTQAKDTDGYAIDYVYNEAQGTLKQVTDSTGTTNYNYYASVDLLKNTNKTLSDGTVAQVDYTYNNYRLTSLQSPTTKYTFSYDVYGNTLQTFLGTRSLIKYTYDVRNGKLLQADFGNGTKVTYTYDHVGNVTSVAYNGTKKYEWETNSAGYTTSHIDWVNKLQTRYEYDSIGRFIRSNTIDLTKGTNTDRSLYATEYGYDLNNNVNKVVNITPTGTYKTTTTYGKDNLPEVFYMHTTRKITYKYDSLNRLDTSTLGTNTPVIIDYDYWASNRNSGTQTLYQTTKLQQEKIGDIVYTYTYDKAGNITSIQEKKGSTVVGTVSYVYDNLNQLTRENNSYLNKTIVYDYDNNGNLQTVKTYAYTTGTPGTVLSTDTYSYEDAEWGDLLTKYNGQALTYDTIGNPLTWRDGMTMTWQDGRRLASLQTASHAVNYTYDADGLRVTKTIDGTKHTYQYVDGLLMYETRGDLKFIYSYDAYGHLSCITYMWADGSYWNFYVACNARGDVTAIYAADGTLRATYTYDSWGNTLSIIDRYGNNIVALGDDAIAADNIGALNRIRYRGYYYDYESGLYYLQSRYYDPQVKRFVNADSYVSTGQGLTSTNMFAYCGNNPVSRADATGDFWNFTAKITEIASQIVSRTRDVVQKVIEQINLNVFTEEQKHFIATIAGEAFGENEETWAAVAHVIVNRKGQHEWSTLTITEILNKDNFTAIGKKQYNLAMEYLNGGRDSSFAYAERYEKLIEVVIPIYYGMVPDTTDGAVFFSKGFNPRYYGEEVFVTGVTNLRFFKYKEE